MILWPVNDFAYGADEIDSASSGFIDSNPILYRLSGHINEYKIFLDLAFSGENFNRDTLSPYKLSHVFRRINQMKKEWWNLYTSIEKPNYKIFSDSLVQIQQKLNKIGRIVVADEINLRKAGAEATVKKLEERYDDKEKKLTSVNDMLRLTKERNVDDKITQGIEATIKGLEKELYSIQERIGRMEKTSFEVHEPPREITADFYKELGCRVNASTRELNESKKIAEVITSPLYRQGELYDIQRLALFTKIYESIIERRPLDIVVYGGAVKNPNVDKFEFEIEYSSENSRKISKIKAVSEKNPTFKPDVAEEGLLRLMGRLRGDIEKTYFVQPPIKVTLVTAGYLAEFANGTKKELSKLYQDGLKKMVKKLGFEDFIQVKDIGEFYKSRKDFSRVLKESKDDLSKSWPAQNRKEIERQKIAARRNIYDAEFRVDPANMIDERYLEDAVFRYALLHEVDGRLDVFGELKNTIRLSLIKNNNYDSGKLTIWPTGEKDVIVTPWQGVGIEYIDAKGEKHLDVITHERLQTGYKVAGIITRIGNEEVAVV